MRAEKVTGSYRAMQQQRRVLKFVDSTALFRDACKGMKLGQMIHGAGFNLWDAMHAAELMDPKMDPSLLAASEASFVTLDLRLKSNSVPLELRPASVLALLDELMCMHVSFLDGYALANTLFSCLYLHRRSVLEHHTKFLVPSNSNVDSSQWHAAWRDACCAAVRAWVRVTAVARSLIQRADIFEEEDFSGNIPHLPPSTFVFADENPIEETSFANLCQEIDVDRVCSELSQAESTLELLLKQITPDQSATSASWIDALLSRLAFIKRYVASLSPLVTEVGSEQNWKAKDVREAARRLKKTIESADKIATSFSMPVEAADYTLSSIQSVPSAFLSNEKPTTTAKSMAAAAISAQSTLVAVPAPGFDPQVARAMTASTPPRYFRLYSRRDALAWLCGALNQLQRVCQIVDCMPTASPIAPRVDDAVMYARSLAAWSVVPSPIQQSQVQVDCDAARHIAGSFASAISGLVQPSSTSSAEPAQYSAQALCMLARSVLFTILHYKHEQSFVFSGHSLAHCVRAMLPTFGLPRAATEAVKERLAQVATAKALSAMAVSEPSGKKKKKGKSAAASNAPVAGETAPTDPSEEIPESEYELIDWCCDRVSKVLAQLLRVWCLSPARQHASLDTILPDLNILLQEVTYVDQQIMNMMSVQLDLDLPEAVPSAALTGTAPPPQFVIYHHPHFSVLFELSTIALQHHIEAAFQIATLAPTEWCVAWAYLEYLNDVRDKNRQLCTRPRSWALRSARKSQRPIKRAGNTAAPTAFNAAIDELSENAVVHTVAGNVPVLAGRSLTSVELMLNEMRVAMCRASYRTAGVLANRGWFPALVNGPSSLQSASIQFTRRFESFRHLAQPEAVLYESLLGVLQRHQAHAKAIIAVEAKLPGQAGKGFGHGAEQDALSTAAGWTDELEQRSKVDQEKAEVQEALREYKRIKPLVDRIQTLAAAPVSLPIPAHWIAYAKNMQRIAVTNSVLLLRLEQLGAGDKPRFDCDWTLSSTFPVFNVRIA